MSDLYQLIYCSRNTVSECRSDMSAEIADILEVSRRNNAHEQITGALLFSAGCFAQVLEGSRERLEAAFERIQADPRHDDTIVLKFELVERREFAAWSMADAGCAPLDAAGERIVSEAIAGDRSSDDVTELLRSLVYRQDDWLRSVA